MHDDLIQKMLPRFITLLSEFLGPLSNIIYLTEEKLYKISVDIMYPYAQAQGMYT